MSYGRATQSSRKATTIHDGNEPERLEFVTAKVHPSASNDIFLASETLLLCPDSDIEGDGIEPEEDKASCGRVPPITGI